MKSLLRVALLPALILAQSLFAQEPAAPADGTPPKTITKEHTVYVPFDKLEEVFGKEFRDRKERELSAA